MNKKNLSVFVLLFFVLTLLGGCKSEENKLEKPKNEVTVVIENDSEVGFDPIKGWGRYSRPLVQSTLLKRGRDDKLINDLAKSYQISEDGRVYSFKLADKVKFSDATSLSLEDIKFTFEKLRNDATEVDLTNLDTVSVEGDEIKFTLKNADITFLYLIADTGIVPKASYGNEYATKPIGSGPYKLVDYKRGEQAIFEVNPYYYGKKPQISRLNLVFANPNTAINLARAGKADVVATSYNLADEKIPHMKLRRVKSIDSRGITLPVDRPFVTEGGLSFGNAFTSDKEVRRAINLAIDRTKLIKEVLLGYGEASFGVAQGLSWSENNDLETDVKKAKDGLKNAGWILGKDKILEKNGVRASFNLYYLASDEVRKAIAYGVKSQLGPLGIDVVPKGASWDEIDKKMYSNPVVMGWGAKTPQEVYNIYHSKNAGKPNYYNPQNYKNKTVDRYLDEGIRQNEVEEVAKYFKKANSNADGGFSLKKDAPWLWLVNIDHLYFVNDRLDVGDKGREPHNHGLPFLDNIEDWKFLR